MALIDAEALLGQPIADLMTSDNSVNLAVDEFFGKNVRLVTEIVWTTAPQIRERAFLSSLGAGEPLIRVNGYTEVVLDKITEKEFYLSVYLDDRYNCSFKIGSILII